MTPLERRLAMGTLAITFQQKFSPAVQQISCFLIVMAVVLAASLFGILTRPMGFLAAIWPANAILLGLMVRKPAFANVWGWVGAFTGYMAADLLTGGEIGITFWLTSANMSGAITGFVLFRLLDEKDRRLSRPLSVLQLFAVCIAVAAVAAITGGGAAQIVFNRDFLSGLEFWFVTELVNSLIILPSMLTYEKTARPLERLSALLGRVSSYWYYAPLLALVISTGIAVMTGGPGAIAYPVPALLWCALTYRIFMVSVITACTCGILLTTVTADLVSASVFDDLLASTSSMRLGISLIALGPLTAASINGARMDLVRQLRYHADHDSLTNTLNRRAFMERATAMTGRMELGTRPVTVLMLDIDHFKAINDTHGHCVGDSVLANFAAVVSAALRPDDIFARVGGEEFAIVISGSSQQDAALLAERVRTAVSTPCKTVATPLPPVTASIGIALSSDHPHVDFEKLLSIADQALYKAKMDGRNRVSFA